MCIFFKILINIFIEMKFCVNKCEVKWGKRVNESFLWNMLRLMLIGYDLG